jgi:hypothetical protein
LFVMAWHWEFSNASVCVQYFRNPGTGTSAILVCPQVHRKEKSAKIALVQITKSNQDRVPSLLRMHESTPRINHWMWWLTDWLTDWLTPRLSCL